MKTVWEADIKQMINTLMGALGRLNGRPGGDLDREEEEEEEGKMQEEEGRFLGQSDLDKSIKIKGTKMRVSMKARWGKQTSADLLLQRKDHGRYLRDLRPPTPADTRPVLPAPPPLLPDPGRRHPNLTRLHSRLPSGQKTEVLAEIYRQRGPAAISAVAEGEGEEDVGFRRRIIPSFGSSSASGFGSLGPLSSNLNHPASLAEDGGFGEMEEEEKEEEEERKICHNNHGP